MTTNYDFSFTKNKKIIFKQNAFGTRIGYELIRFIERSVRFPSYYFHYQAGGHVAALHQHLESSWFFRIDFKDFFYSISRNRVAAALHEARFSRARTFAKWSCVRSPIKGGPRYALPIGFVQSPALATMVLMRTNVARVLDRAASRGVIVSVYLDDLIGSGVNRDEVQGVFEELILAAATANLPISERKLVEPCAALQAFNCDLTVGNTEVTADRRSLFYSVSRTASSSDAFERYCKTVSVNNR